MTAAARRASAAPALGALWATDRRRPKTDPPRPPRTGHAAHKGAGASCRDARRRRSIAPTNEGRCIVGSPRTIDDFHSVETVFCGQIAARILIFEEVTHTLWANRCGAAPADYFPPILTALFPPLPKVKLRFSCASPRVMVLSTNPQPRSGSLVNLN